MFIITQGLTLLRKELNSIVLIILGGEKWNVCQRCASLITERNDEVSASLVAGYPDIYFPYLLVVLKFLQSVFYVLMYTGDRSNLLEI